MIALANLVLLPCWANWPCLQAATIHHAAALVGVWLALGAGSNWNPPGSWLGRFAPSSVRRGESRIAWNSCSEVRALNGIPTRATTTRLVRPCRFAAIGCCASVFAGTAIHPGRHRTPVIPLPREAKKPKCGLRRPSIPISHALGKPRAGAESHLPNDCAAVSSFCGLSPAPNTDRFRAPGTRACARKATEKGRPVASCRRAIPSRPRKAPALLRIFLHGAACSEQRIGHGWLTVPVPVCRPLAFRCCCPCASALPDMHG